MWPGYARIDKFTAGEDFDFNVYFHGVPTGQRLNKAWLTIKNDPSDADSAALWQKIITIVDDGSGNRVVADGSLVVTDPDFGTIPAGTALIHWKVPREITAVLPQGPYLPHDTKVQASSGNEAYIDKGVFKFYQAITQAS